MQTDQYTMRRRAEGKVSYGVISTIAGFWIGDIIAVPLGYCLVFCSDGQRHCAARINNKRENAATQ